MKSTRRDFISKSTISIGLALAGAATNSQEAAVKNDALPKFKTPTGVRKGDMIYRKLGRTGQDVSLIGIGGSHIGYQKDEQDSIRIMRSAIDRGVTFMDNCWDYNNGVSEERMGKALLNGYREKVFLMTKIDGQKKEIANRQLEESLKRLQTDHIDLIQMHEVIRMDDPDRIFAKGGAIEALMEAKKAGKVRFIGFTGHKDPAIHLKMLETADKHGFTFDTAQMPLNVMDAHYKSFTTQVVPVLLKKRMGVLGMKSMGSGIILKSGIVKAMECLHYAMTLPTSVVITGIDSMPILDQAIEAVKSFKPLTDAEITELLGRTIEAAKNGQYEPFKTTNGFDGTIHNPQWLG